MGHTAALAMGKAAIGIPPQVKVSVKHRSAPQRVRLRTKPGSHTKSQAGLEERSPLHEEEKLQGV